MSYKKYSKEIQIEYAKRYVNGEKSALLAREIGCSNHRIPKWVRKYIGSSFVRENKLLTNKLELLRDNERAYIAGIIDGEGCITIHKNKAYYSIYINVSNTDKHLMDWLVNKCGGSLCFVSGKNKHGINRKPQWAWTVNGQYAIFFLKRIYEFLIVKKERANLAIDFGKNIVNCSGGSISDNELSKRQAYRLRMQILNKKGI